MIWGNVFFPSVRRERVPGAAERMAAAAGRPSGSVTPLGGSKPPVMIRDLNWERAFTARAAEAGGVRCVLLSRFAEDRAGAGDVRAPDRDFPLEVLEELADARNYLVWTATREMLKPTPAEELLGRAFASLVLVAQAFDAALRLRDWRPAV